MINPPELPINHGAQNDEHNASLGVPQRWATATLKLAALPPSLFAKCNSGATPPATEQKYWRAIAIRYR